MSELYCDLFQDLIDYRYDKISDKFYFADKNHQRIEEHNPMYIVDLWFIYLKRLLRGEDKIKASMNSVIRKQDEESKRILRSGIIYAWSIRNIWSRNHSPNIKLNQKH